jgi:hypothetical protein
MPAKRKKQRDIFATIKQEFETPDYGLKQFRKDLAKLKKKGLVSKKIDARSQTATRYMLGQVRKFADVLSGKAAVLTVPKHEKSYYKETGHRTKGSKVVVQTPHGETARRSKPVNGIPAYQTSKGKSAPRIHTLTPFSQLEHWLRQTVVNAPPRKKGEVYGFKFFGHNSYRLFADKESLLEYFLAYQSVDEEIRKGRETESQEIYQNFVVVKVPDAKQWNAEIRTAHDESKQSRAAANRERHNEWRRRRYAEMDELERRERREASEQTKKNNAERERARRAAIKLNNPAAYEAERAKSAARVAKSRAKKKAAK